MVRHLRPRVLATVLGVSLALPATALASLAPVDIAPPVAASPVEIAGGSDILAAVGGVKLTLRASGLSHPVFATTARDGTNRTFILQQSGRIRILKGSTLLSTPYLNLEGGVGTAFEQGLLGMAFHPNFATNHKFYVSYTDLAQNIVVREWRQSPTNPNRAVWSGSRTIIKIAKPYNNHNGGMLAFGTDGYLYISTGDGGGNGDTGNHAQDLTSLLGKILRINVNGTTATTQYTIPASNPFVGVAGRDEIWMYGLRNPWRWSFDRSTGDIWIGDVGQMTWEEIDRAPKTSSGAGPGTNWGWHILEGTHCFNPATGCDPTGTTAPLLEYEHLNGRCAVVGGYAYRGHYVAALAGKYVFGDYCTGEIWTLPLNATAPATPTLLFNTSFTISSFGENSSNELLVLDRGGGRMYRLDHT